MFPGILESVSGDVLAGCPGNDLEVLDDARHDFVLEPAVLSLGVFSDGDDINILVWGVDALKAFARPDIRVQLELLPQGHVQGPEALPDWRLEGALQSELVLAQGVQRVFGNEVALLGLPTGVDIVVLEFYRDLQLVEDVNNCLRNLRADPITRE